MQQNQALPTLIWADGFAALAAGGLVLPLSNWLANWLQLPVGLLHFMGVVNLLYALYSINFATQPQKTKFRLMFLIVSNLLWVFFCIGAACYFWPKTNYLGVGYLLGESIFVLVLASLEWQQYKTQFQ